MITFSTFSIIFMGVSRVIDGSAISFLGVVSMTPPSSLRMRMGVSGWMVRFLMSSRGVVMLAFSSSTRTLISDLAPTDRSSRRVFGVVVMIRRSFFERTVLASTK